MKQIAIKLTDSFHKRILAYKVDGPTELIEAIRHGIEVKRGKWVLTDNFYWVCSECGGNPNKGTGFTPNADNMKSHYRYCPLCGAKMEGAVTNGRI